jgi:hypothetical protein
MLCVSIRLGQFQHHNNVGLKQTGNWKPWQSAEFDKGKLGIINKKDIYLMLPICIEEIWRNH